MFDSLHHVLSDNGISIFTRIKNLDNFKLEPASLNPLPTCLIPKFVKRIIGGNANIIVATTPGLIQLQKALPQELNKQSLEWFA